MKPKGRAILTMAVGVSVHGCAAGEALMDICSSMHSFGFCWKKENFSLGKEL
jgi:hypothetical protein